MLNNSYKRFFVSFFCVFLLSGTVILSAKPKNKSAEAKDEPAVFKKYIHPREYVFDLSDSKGKISLKVDSTTGKAYCNVNFTDFVKEQMPRKGDKITFTYEGYASTAVEAITATVYDLSKGENIGNKAPEIFTTKVGKKETFKKNFSLILKDDAEKDFTLRLTGVLPESKKKVDKVDLSFKRVTESTNTKKEAEAEQQAIKKGLKIVRVKSNFTVVEKKVPVKSEPEETPEVQETNDQDIAETVESEETEEKVSSDVEPETEASEIEQEPAAEEANEVLEDIVETEVVLESIIEQEIPVEEVVPEEMIEVAELEPIQEKVVIKVEPQVIPESPKIIVPESKNDSTYEPIIVKNKVSRYEKEYLQDYAVMDELELTESETDEIPKILEPNKADKNGRTLLMIASKNGDKKQISNLLYSGADVNLKDKEGWTALMYAARYQKDISCLDLLLDADAAVKEKNKYGLTALILAANYNSNPQILERLVKFYSPSDKELLKSFVIMLSECTNSVDVQLSKTKIFIETSLPINAFYNGKTPLMYAAEYCESTKIIRALIENNAHTTVRSTEGKTAFDYAVNNINLEHDNVYWTLNKK